MFLNDISSLPNSTFNKINKFLEANYGYRLSQDADFVHLNQIRDQIFEEIKDLKIKGDDAKTSPGISQRLLILEGIRHLSESLSDNMTSPQYDMVCQQLASKVVDSFLISGVCTEDFEDSIRSAMCDYRSSIYRFPDTAVESMIRNIALSRLEEITGCNNSSDSSCSTLGTDSNADSELIFNLEDNSLEKKDQVMFEKQEIIKSLRSLLESQVSQAQVMMAAKGFAQELQEMVEKVGRLQNEDLPPVTDQMRETYGTDSASTFQTQIYSALQSVMDSLYTAKNQIDDAVESLATSGRIGAVSDMDQDMPEPDIGDASDPDEINDLDNLDLPEPEAGELSREKKMESLHRLGKRITEMKILVDRAKRLKESNKK